MYTENLTNVWLGAYTDSVNRHHDEVEDTMVFVFMYGPLGLRGLPKDIRQSLYKVTVGQIEEFNRNHNKG